MGKILRPNFDNKAACPRENAAFREFEKNMLKYERKKKWKMTFMMVGFSLLIIGAMATPFAFEALVTSR